MWKNFSLPLVPWALTIVLAGQLRFPPKVSPAAGPATARPPNVSMPALATTSSFRNGVRICNPLCQASDDARGGHPGTGHPQPTSDSGMSAQRRVIARSAPVNSTITAVEPTRLRHSRSCKLVACGGVTSNTRASSGTVTGRTAGRTTTRRTTARARPRAVPVAPAPPPPTCRHATGPRPPRAAALSEAPQGEGTPRTTGPRARSPPSTTPPVHWR